MQLNEHSISFPENAVSECQNIKKENEENTSLENIKNYHGLQVTCQN